MNNDKLTRSIVHDAHRQQQQHGENNDQKLVQLANILGGIDVILNEYLSNKTIQLSETQLNNIHEIITESQHITYPKGLDQINTSNNIEDHDKLYLELDLNDTFLYDKLGENAQKIMKVVYHEVTFSILVVSAIIWCILATPYFADLTYPIYIIVMSLCLWIPFVVLLLLSSNRKAAKMALKTFEFWLKLAYSIIYFTATFIDFYGVNFDFFSQSDTIIMMIADVIFLAILIPLVVVVVSFWDALNGHRKKKVALTAAAALMFTMYAVYLNFILFVDDGNDVSVTHNRGDIEFPVLNVRITSLKILSIFLWKNCVYAYYRKEKAVSVRVCPYLVWKGMQKSNMSLHSNLDEAEDLQYHETIDSDLNIPAVNSNNIKVLPHKLAAKQLSDDIVIENTIQQLQQEAFKYQGSTEL